MALVICIFIIILSNDQLNFSTSTPPSEFHFHLLKEGGGDDFVIMERKWNLCNFTFIEKSSYRNHGTKFDFITTIVLRTRAKIWKLYCKLTINRHIFKFNKSCSQSSQGQKLHSDISTYQMQCILLYNLIPLSQHMSACNWIDLISHWLLTADGNLCMAWFEINTLQFISQFYLDVCTQYLCDIQFPANGLWVKLCRI